ncbi:MAG: ComF family protein [Betaproteobacteria bacterium]|jgi:ComF family protein|nr:ComF family protein [Betaproteobacteria bacterium]
MTHCQTAAPASRLRALLRRCLDSPPCALCGAVDTPGALLCSGCHDDLPWTTAARGDAGGDGDGGGTGGGGTAEAVAPVIEHRRAAGAAPVAARVAALDYRFPVDAMIRRLKFDGELWLAPVLGGLLFERCVGAARPDCLLPIPLSERRLAERGFNQSTEIARVLSRRTGIALQPALLRRARDTPPQSGLPLAGRADNLRGAFVVDRPVAGMHIALVDDVTTTGATGAEAARSLLGQGAARVDLWVVARTPRAGDG